MSFRWRSGVSAVISLTCLGLISYLPITTSAATPSSNNAIRVTPTLSNITLSPGEASATIDATVTNLTSSPLRVGLSGQDFSASTTQAGAVQFYGAGYNPSTNPHGLQTAISFASPVISLGPNQAQKVVVTLNDLSKLAPGGHYGAILFNPEPGTGSIGSTHISIGSSVASLIFLTTANGGTDSLSLSSFPVGRIQFTLPRTSYLAFQETGNTQTSPQGQLTLYGPSGSIISTTVVNPGEGLVLPGTTRLFPTQLSLTSLRFARPGIYRLELQYHSRTSTTLITVNKRFFYINLALIIPVIVLVALLLFVLLRYGSSLFAIIRWTYRVVRKPFKKKQAPPPPPERPKKPTRLIQG